MSLASLFNQSVTLYNRSSYNSEGTEVLGATSTIKARVQEVSKRKLMPNGSVLIIDALCYVSPSVTVNTDDKLAYNSTNYKVIGKSVAVDGQGNVNHYKLELVKWRT